ncbi:MULTISPECIES: DUF4142 domain-containing protein [unclassified Cupriavidus]|uniref:DUF4142 domain-containing protein n=1 Tax=Cupriavidus sp. H19C3 TaxID=3241603 RepID=UPI003BF85223
MKPNQNDMSRQTGLHTGRRLPGLAAGIALASTLASAFVSAFAQPSAFVPAQAIAPAPGESRVPPNPAPTKPPTTSLSTDDLRFVDEAIMASEMEVAASELALQVSSDPKVTAFARRMVKDHGAAAEALRKLAREQGVTPQKRVPEAPELARLRSLKPPQFEEAYIRTVAVDAHEQAVLLFQNQATRGKDPALRAYADRLLPMLREHLKAGHEMEQRVTASIVDAVR